MNMQLPARLTGVTCLDFTPDKGDPVRFGELHFLEPFDSRRGDAAGARTSLIQCDLDLARQLVHSWKGDVDVILDVENVTDRKGRRSQLCRGVRPSKS